MYSRNADGEYNRGHLAAYAEAHEAAEEAKDAYLEHVAFLEAELLKDKKRVELLDDFAALHRRTFGLDGAFDTIMLRYRALRS